MNQIWPLWFVFLAIMAYLFERETHWFTRFNVFTVFVVGMLLRYGIVVPFSDSVNVIFTGISITQSQLTEYYVAVVLAWIVAFATVFILRRLLNRPAIARSIKVRAAGRPGWTADWAVLVVALTLTALVAAVFIVIPWGLYSQAFAKIFAIGHTAAEYNQHRYDYAKETLYASSALNYAGSFARYGLMPAVVLILFFQRSRSRRIKVALAVSVLVLAIVGLSSGQKQPALLLVLTFAVAWVVANGSKSIFTWRAGGLVVMLTGLVVLLYHFQYPTETRYWQLFALTVYRETFEYSRAAQLRFVFYPDRHQFLLGLGSFIARTILHVAHVNTGDAQSPETYIPTHTPGFADYQSTWNGGFFADGWADFGWFGVVATSILVGAVLVGVETWFHAGPTGPTQVGTYVAVCLGVLAITDVSLTTALWTYGIFTSFVAYWFFRLFPADPRASQDGISVTAATAGNRS